MDEPETAAVVGHLVFVDHTARLSGAELALREMAAWALADRVTVVLQEDGPLVDEVRLRGAEVLVVPLPAALRLTRSARPSLFALLRAVAAGVSHAFVMWRLLRRERADVVYLNTLSTLVLTGLPARLAARRVVWHVRDAIAPPHTGRLTTVVVRLLVLLTCTAVIANSRFTLTQLGTLPRRIRRLVLSSPVPSPPGRTSLPGATSGLNVVMVGRLTEWKGQHIFLEAFAEAFAGRPGYHASLAGAAMFPGDREYEAALVEQIHHLGITTQVDLLGHVTDVPQLLSRADVVVHASVKPEPFGQVVVQGLLAGAAVIASDAGGPAEIITQNETGLLVRPGDSIALADALRRLDQNRQLLQELASHASTVESTYGAEAVERSLRAFLAGL